MSLLQASIVGPRNNRQHENVLIFWHISQTVDKSLLFLTLRGVVLTHSDLHAIWKRRHNRIKNVSCISFHFKHLVILTLVNLIKLSRCSASTHMVDYYKHVAAGFNSFWAGPQWHFATFLCASLLCLLTHTPVFISSGWLYINFDSMGAT